MKNYRLVLSYDGTRYKGWQRLKTTDNTIQGKAEAALERILGAETELHSSGRTDAGVHARRQVCSFRTDSSLPASAILAQLRELLPEDIGALELAEAAPRFHARYNCRERHYVYRVWCGDEPNVFERRYLYFFRAKPDLAAMRRAAEALTGEHDFAAFTSEKKGKRSTVRCIRSLEIQACGSELRFDIRADGFLWNMVRIIVGTLLEVGDDRRDADSVPAVLASGCRENAGFTVPARGLILWDAEY